LRDATMLRAWLMSVAANEARQLMRHRHRHRLVAIEVADIGTSRGDPAIDVALADLAVALSRLSPEDRALIAMRFVGGYDATEIARTTGISASGVRSRLARLLARLRTELDHD
jgi:RNA polymerase sigma factor (sigma-70 family)